MNLVVDIGNTNIVLATIKETTIFQYWRLPTQKNLTEKEILKQLTEIFTQGYALEVTKKIKHIGLATVVPTLQASWSNALKTIFNRLPLILNVSKCNTFKIDYDVITQIGPDRLCNILACQALNISEAIVVDLGTATTFDIYSHNTYWGGVICPGILSSLKDLSQKASLLSEVELFWNDNIIGKNTDDALRNGILYGSVGQIEAILKKILVDLPMKKPSIIATGGLSKLIGKKASMIQRFEEHFTLIGLNYFIALQIKTSIN